jgi:hypothetical protein
MTSNCMTLANATSSWNHLAVTWNQGRVAFYCNGVARGTGTVGTAGTTTLFPSNAPLRIGESGFASSSKMPIKAEIDEFRMSKTVRYPAAFTVPSSEFTPD